MPQQISNEHHKPKRGGQRAGSGAKMIGDVKRLVTSVSISPDNLSIARQIGGGKNASAGINLALEQHSRMLEFIEHVAGMADRAEKYVDAKALRSISDLAQDELNEFSKG